MVSDVITLRRCLDYGQTEKKTEGMALISLWVLKERKRMEERRWGKRDGEMLVNKDKKEVHKSEKSVSVDVKMSGGELGKDVCTCERGDGVSVRVRKV